MGRNDPTQDEIDAKNICCKYLGYDEKTLFVSDSPDLQDTITNIGIEVRHVMNKIDGKNNALVQSNYNSQRSIEEKNIALKKMNVDGINLDLGFMHIFCDGRLRDMKDFYEHQVREFVNAYEDKLCKLNSGNYKMFKENNLFLFCDYYNKEQIDEALKNLSQNLKAGKYYNFSNKFNFIYAYAFKNIYVIDSCFKIIRECDHTK